MRKTKIICTIGPASSDPQIFADMCRAGLNVARLNFSHGTHAEQLAKLNMIKQVREALNLPIAIMLDTKGPEYRIRTFQNGKIMLHDGDSFTFTTRDVPGDEHIVSVSYDGLAGDLAAGDTILVNNGLVIFRVEQIDGTEIHCTVAAGGELSDRKSMSFPGKVLEQVYLSEQDKDDLLFGIENGVDFIAASFVSRKQDIVDLKEFLAAHGGSHIDVIAKIENRAGIDNIDEICQACEGIMIGRGDRLQHAKECGADFIVDITKEDPVESVLKITNGFGVDEVLECSGASVAPVQGMRMLKRGGKMGLVGHYHDPELKIPNLTDMITNELTIYGSRANPGVSEAVISMLARGVINGDSLVTHRFPLEQYETALDVFVGRKDHSLKVVINP